jgi:hypothetical protein
MTAKVAVEMNEINPRYENTRKIHLISDYPSVLLYMISDYPSVSSQRFLINYVNHTQQFSYYGHVIMIINFITSCIGILDFDWLIADVFFVYFHI